ncbi:MAG: hypothetical protein U9N40_09150 [Euryarchaeota archaeon]|nr:hypothetical protein [Euryarchaeota archaeon]
MAEGLSYRRCCDRPEYARSRTGAITPAGLLCDDPNWIFALAFCEPPGKTGMFPVH